MSDSNRADSEGRATGSNVEAGRVRVDPQPQEAGGDAASFRPGRGLTVAFVGALVILLGLGAWQWQRMIAKNLLIERIEAGLLADPTEGLPAESATPGDADYRLVRVTGRLLNEQTLRYGYQAGRDGEARVGVLTPMATETGRSVLIHRGTVRAEDWAAIRDAPSRTTTVTGYLRAFEGIAPGWFAPEPDAADRHVFTIDREQIAALIETPPGAYILFATAPSGAPVPVEPTTARVDLPNDHFGYALTWWGLAAGLIGVYLVYGFRRGRDA